MAVKSLDGVNAQLFGNTAPAWKPLPPSKVNKRPAGRIGGRILDANEVQRREVIRKEGKAVQGDLKFWPDGRPMMQIVLTIDTTRGQFATNEIDKSDPTDDGIRRVFVRGRSKQSPESIQDALIGAVRAAGAAKAGIEIGADVWFECYRLAPRKTGEDESVQRAKMFKAKYARPSVEIGDDDKSDPLAGEEGDDDGYSDEDEGYDPLED